MTTSAIFLLAFYGARASSTDYRNEASVEFASVTIVHSAPPITEPAFPTVRLPALVEQRASGAKKLPLPAILTAERGMLSVESMATLIIRANGSQSDCRNTDATIRRMFRNEMSKEIKYDFDLCGYISANNSFKPAIDSRGVRIDHPVVVRGRFYRGTMPIAPVAPRLVTSGKVPGHAIVEHWDTATDWIASNVVLQPNDWKMAPFDTRKIPKNTHLGAYLALSSDRVTSCTIESSSGDINIDNDSCRFLMQSKYVTFQKYAEEKSFNFFPIFLSFNDGNVEMVAPARPELPHMPEDISLFASDAPDGAKPSLLSVPLNVELDHSGHVIRCEVEESSQSDGWDAMACQIVLKRGKFTAAQDGFRRPARGTYELMADFEAMVIRPRNSTDDVRMFGN